MSARQHHMSERGRSSSLRGVQGVSLLEVMAAAVISVLVVAAGYAAMITGSKSTRVNEQMAQTQQNVRVAMELLARDVKLAGFGLTTAAVGACTAPIVPADNNPGGADAGPDSVSLVVPVTNANPAVGALWQLSANAIGPFTVITLPGGAPTAVADMVSAGLDATAGSESTISIGGAASSTVTAIDAPAANQLTLTTQIGAPKTFPIGTQVHLLQCVTYSISTDAVTCGGAAGETHSCLTRTTNGLTVPMVDGIEDLQLAYACDGCNGTNADGIPDNQNGVAGFDVGDFVTDNTWAVAPMTADKIRLVQISIVARQPAPDQGVSETADPGVVSPTAVVVSDHDPSTDAGFNINTYQTQRRRVLTRVVETRNMGP